MTLFPSNYQTSYRRAVSPRQGTNPTESAAQPTGPPPAAPVARPKRPGNRSGGSHPGRNTAVAVAEESNSPLPLGRVVISRAQPLDSGAPLGCFTRGCQPMCFREVENRAFTRLGTAAFLVGGTQGSTSYRLLGTGGALQVTESTQLGISQPDALAG